MWGGERMNECPKCKYKIKGGFPSNMMAFFCPSCKTLFDLNGKEIKE